MASKVAIQNAEMSKFVVPCSDERSYHSWIRHWLSLPLPKCYRYRYLPTFLRL